MDDIPEDMMITIKDVRQAGHCVRGAKEWCERNDLDFRRLIGDGLTAREVAATGDEHGLRTVRLKLERTNNGR